MKPKSLQHNFIVYFIRTLFSGLTPLLIFPYASRILGVSNIGGVTYAQTIAIYFEHLAMLGINSYAVREGAKYRDNPSAFGKLMTELVIINVGSTALSCTIYTIMICTMSGLQPYRVFLLVFLLEIVFHGLNFEWFYNIIEDYDYIARRTVIFQFISIVVLLVFVRSENDALAYAIVLLLPYMLTSITNFATMLKRVKLFGYRDYHFKSHIIGTISVFSVVVSTLMCLMIDTTMLGIMRGDYDVGIYTAASKLTRECSQLIKSLCAVFLPRLSVYRAKGQVKDFQRVAANACNIIMILSIPATVGMFSLSTQAILIFSGKDYLAAVPAMQILTLNFMFAAIDGFFGWQVLVPYNEEKILFGATFAGAMIDVALNLLLIPHFNTVGAACATLFAEIVTFCILLYRTKKYLPLSMIFRNLWQYVLCALPIWVICRVATALFPNFILSTVVSVLFAVPVYFLLLYAIKNPYARQYCDKGLQWIRTRLAH